LSGKIFQDRDVSTRLLRTQTISIIGYGNQGRAQALNLRDSGLRVLIGNRNDKYRALCRKDGFAALPISEAVKRGNIVMMLIPDELQPEVFEEQVAENLREGATLDFASGFNIAFGLIKPPEYIDVVMVAPRMIGEGVRDNYVSGKGFPSFVGVAQDRSGHARETALEIAKDIGSTKMGAVEVSFKQEAELDLFTEQCFGPAFGQVLTTAAMFLVEEGYPAAAVLLELYLSGELSYTFGKASEVGLIDQMKLHSPTSRYGSLTRALRFADLGPEIRNRLQEGLKEIRTGEFAKEWMNEREHGYPTLKAIQGSISDNPLSKLEKAVLSGIRRTG
jgi:ketol-acid reductoisomerase